MPEKKLLFTTSISGANELMRTRELTDATRSLEDAKLAFADVRRAVSRRSARAILTFVDEVFTNQSISDGLTSTGDAVQHENRPP